jgi:NAD(P)H-nitrite reductase large subunit
MQNKIIVIGNGAAGTSACSKIREIDPNVNVEIISAENVIGYNRPMLTKGILSKEQDPKFSIKPEEWYKENDISLSLGTRAEKIDIENKNIFLSNGHTRGYNKLILATGAESNIPNIDGRDLEGVFSIRTLVDVAKVRSYLLKVEKIVIVGGGLLGLEIAWEMCRVGKDVTIIQNSTKLMNKQLDSKGSDILRKVAGSKGISFNGGIGCARLVGHNGAVNKVVLKDGTHIEADMVILSAGIRANVGLAKEAGIAAERFIEVNNKMETNIKGIYACGDCAIYGKNSFGLWNQAVEMGKIAGSNAAGVEAFYETVVPSTFFNGMGTMLFSIGDPGKDPEKKYTSIELHDEDKDTYEKLYFYEDSFVGGILIGDMKRSTRLIKAYKNGESPEELQV